MGGADIFNVLLILLDTRGLAPRLGSYTVWTGRAGTGRAGTDAATGGEYSLNRRRFAMGLILKRGVVSRGTAEMAKAMVREAVD